LRQGRTWAMVGSRMERGDVQSALPGAHRACMQTAHWRTLERQLPYACRCCSRGLPPPPAGGGACCARARRVTWPRPAGLSGGRAGGGRRCNQGDAGSTWDWRAGARSKIATQIGSCRVAASSLKTGCRTCRPEFPCLQRCQPVSARRRVTDDQQVRGAHADRRQPAKLGVQHRQTARMTGQGGQGRPAGRHRRTRRHVPLHSTRTAPSTPACSCSRSPRPTAAVPVIRRQPRAGQGPAKSAPVQSLCGRHPVHRG